MLNRQHVRLDLVLIVFSPRACPRPERPLDLADDPGVAI